MKIDVSDCISKTLTRVIRLRKKKKIKNAK